MVRFYKYHGAGNDFIMIDNRNNDIKTYNPDLVSRLCNRHFGIGADGLILLNASENYDFRMIYYNSDGYEGTMCGNGGRCITAFAEKLGIIETSTVFEGIDGIHEAIILNNGMYKLKMKNVEGINHFDDGDFLDTGSDHFIQYRNSIDDIDVFREGREIRYQSRFGAAGTNVNFVERIDNNEIKIRTFERGVENETLACGTGAVASAISAFIHGKPDKSSYIVHVRGGQLLIEFEKENDYNFNNIWLTGPAEFVFSGEINLSILS